VVTVVTSDVVAIIRPTFGADYNEGMTLRDWCCHPFIVALAMTGLNAIKPVAVDDAAYLMIAEAVAKPPHRLYQQTHVWNSQLVDGMDLLCPPLMPAYLATGRYCLSPDETALKIWLLPFALALTFSTRFLARTWRLDDSIVPVVAFGGSMLPLFGFMLDVPAVGLGLASLACLVRGGVAMAVLAGVLAALAFQTKYTMLTGPIILTGYAVLHRRWLDLMVAVPAAVTLIHGWEVWIVLFNGQSHFLHHLKGQSPKGVHDLINAKVTLLLAFLRHGGFLLIGPSLVAFQAIVNRPRWTYALAFAATVVFLGVTFLPSPWGARFCRIGWPVLGLFMAATSISTMLRVIASREPLDRFLLGWMVLELIASVVLSPFPAGRRLVPFGVAFAFAAFRIAGARRLGPGIWVGPLLGLGFFALDAWDVRTEKVALQRAAEKLSGEKNVTVYGTWGLQYYAEQQPNWQWAYVDRRPIPFSPPGTFMVGVYLNKGDIIIAPSPGTKMRCCPNHLPRFEHISVLELIETIAIDDTIPGSTVPSLYAECDPLTSRTGPRLSITIYRVKSDLVVGR
jgi:hypothetical protein